MNDIFWLIFAYLINLNKLILKAILRKMKLKNSTKLQSITYRVPSLRTKMTLWALSCLKNPILLNEKI